MELSFVTPGTQTHRYALKLAGLPEDTGPRTAPVDPAWMDDALATAVRVFDVHRVHFVDAYLTYRAHEAAQRPKRTAGKTTTARVAGDLHDDTPLPADAFTIMQLVALVPLEASGVADVIDIHLMVEHLRDDAPIPPVDGIGDMTSVSETDIGVQSAASRH